jgi:hypothetical protein
MVNSAMPQGPHHHGCPRDRPLGRVYGGFVTYNPLVLDPGQSGTINVAISPTDPIGTKVSGFLALETFNFTTFSSDELVSLPYAYTVG